MYLDICESSTSNTTGITTIHDGTSLDSPQPSYYSPSSRWQSAGSHTRKNRDVVEVVDLTDSDPECPSPECQAAKDGQPRAEGERAHDMTLRLCYGNI